MQFYSRYDQSVSMPLRSFPLLFQSTPSTFRFSCWFGQPFRVLFGSAPVDRLDRAQSFQFTRDDVPELCGESVNCLGGVGIIEKTGGSQTRILECSIFQITERTFDERGFRHGKVERYGEEFVIGDSIVVDRMTPTGNDGGV